MRTRSAHQPLSVTTLEQRLADRRAELDATALRDHRPSVSEKAPGWSPASLAVATAVHLVTLALAGFGVWMLVVAPLWPVVVAGLLLIAIALAVAPRPGKRPADVPVLDPTSAPSLFTVLDRIGSVTGAVTPSEVWVYDGLVPSARRVGWRSTAAIGIGTSLWVPASPEARTALLAHQVAHLSRVHPVQRWWIDPAHQTLLNWFATFDDSQDPRMGPQWFVQTSLMVPARLLVSACLKGSARVRAGAVARTEHLADRDAVTAAGTRGASELLDLMLCNGVVEAAFTRAALRVTRRRPEVWSEVREAVRTISPDSMAARRRTPPEGVVRLDDVHPTTPLRLAAIEALPSTAPAVRIEPALWEAVDAELAELVAAAGHAAADRVRSVHRKQTAAEPSFPSVMVPPPY